MNTNTNTQVLNNNWSKTLTASSKTFSSIRGVKHCNSEQMLKIIDLINLKLKKIYKNDEDKILKKR